MLFDGEEVRLIYEALTYLYDSGLEDDSWSESDKETIEKMISRIEVKIGE